MQKPVWETPEEIDMALAKRVREIRKRRGISQKLLSERCGVSYGSIKRFETTGLISFLSLTKIMTENNKTDMENMFCRACFNVFAHNRDDHAKNFTFLYDPETDRWHLSPAYDMTYSSTYYGEHTTSVDGNGKNPGEKELLAVGIKAGMEKEKCRAVIAEIQKKVREDL